jgi:alpha-L-rhamnosidase
VHPFRAPRPTVAGSTTRRWLGALAAASVVAGPALVGGWAAAAAAPAAVTVDGLRIDNRDDQPLGVDDPSPLLSWQLAGSGPDARQTAYEVRVADATGRSLWDTGRVDGSVAQVEYAGKPLSSRTQVSWQVRVWDGEGDASAWSAASTFEMGLLDESDWDDAKWIQSPQSPLNRGVTIDLGGTRDARYVRLDVTKLGLPTDEGGSRGIVSRIQLVEVQVLTPNGTNVALGRNVSVYDQFACPGCGTKLLTDGKVISPGYMSRDSKTQEISPSKWVQIDLGSVQSVDRVVLFPRTDARLPDGQIPGFPVDFTIRASATSSAPTDVVATVVDQPNPQGPDLEKPLPIFAKPFAATNEVADARLYIAGLGAYDATINGVKVTDTVLNPGVTNPLRSVEYGTYDVTSLVKDGDNTLGVALGNGMTYVYPQANAATGRSDVYTKFNSAPVPDGTLTAAVQAGATTLALSGVGGYAVGDTVHVDTGDGGGRLESRKVAAIEGNTLTVDEPLGNDHAAGAAVLGSGSPAKPQMAVSPRLIARLELTYADGSTSSIASDPSWRYKDGPTTTDNFYSGTDLDARLVQAGWDEPGADLSDEQGWADSWITSPPSLDTELAWRKAPPVRVQREFRSTQAGIKQIGPGSWSFDLGQNFAGMPQLNLPGGAVPGGTVIRMTPGESRSGTGVVSTASAGSATGILNTYTTSGGGGGESFTPQFMYHGFQYVQVDGLPAGFTPTPDTLVGLAVNADVPSGGSVTTDNELINRIHGMSEWSIRSNMQSIFTDCPHREKLGWLADMIQSMGSIQSNFDVSAYLRGMQRQMLESQQPDGLIPGTAPEFPIFGGGYRDDVNWGGAFILTPYELWKTYDDTATMAEYYEPMQEYLSYVRAQVKDGLLVSGLGDWIAGDTTTPKDATGTYGLWVIADKLSQMAAELGHADDAADYRQLATTLGEAFHAKFYNPTTKSYTNAGAAGTTGSQTLDALPLAMGIVPAEDTEAVLDDLEKRIRDYHPGANGAGPHMSGGTVGLQPTYRVLMDNGRGELLWDVIQEPTAPSYANFVAQGRTTIPESWDFAGSQNHMILLQVDEWFNAGLAGIQQAVDSKGFDEIIVKPQPVGTLGHVDGRRETPHGTVSSEWTRNAAGILRLDVTVPGNTTGEVWVPTLGKGVVAPPAATYVRDETTGDTTYAVYTVVPGSYKFRGGVGSPRQHVPR